MATTAETHTKVTQLYVALFGRAPDAEGLEFWSGLVSGGQSLEQVADRMFATEPARAYYPSNLFSDQIIASFYRNVLGREADAGGLAFWTGKLDEPGATPGSVIVQMIRNVADYGGADPAGLFSQALFNNRVSVAQHYGEAGGGVAAASAILLTVTSDPASATAVIAAIDAAGADAPVFAGATVNGRSLVLTYADASALDADHPPAASAFTVTVDDVARAVTSVAVNAEERTVTLTLAAPVTRSEAVTVAYKDPTSGNDPDAIQDASGHDAASLGKTAVSNKTPSSADFAAPVFTEATVDGAILSMKYADVNALDGVNVPLAGAFTVTVGGVAREVNAVSVNAATKTVTLVLASAVKNGQVVTVAYADPTAGDDARAIQDASGNDAASLPSTEVLNVTAGTAPTFSRATVNGASLVLIYTGFEPLDAAHVAPATAFSVKVGGVERAVDSVSVDSAAKTVTLTLASAVANADVVKVSYTDPTAGDDAEAIQDTDGDDAASFSSAPVANLTADTVPPVFASATVNAATLVMTYTEASRLDAANPPLPGAFSVTVGGVARAVSAVAVDATAKTVTLTLASAVFAGELVTVAYTDPSGGNDASAIQDASGNDAASLAASPVTNNTPGADVVPPSFAGATVNGDALVMTYTDADLLDAANPPGVGAFTVMVAGVARAVSAVAVNAAAKTVTLTLASPVGFGQVVTVAYGDPTGGNDAAAIQDASGNDAASLAATSVVNNTPDTTPPVFASATVNGSTLVMTYSDVDQLDAVNTPTTAAFAVTVGGVARAVSSVAVNGAARTVTLTLGTPVVDGDVVTVAYNDLTGGNDTNVLQDGSGNDAATLAATPVTNTTPDTTPPSFTGATVDGATLVLTFSDLHPLSASGPAAGAFVVEVAGVARGVNGVSVDAVARTVTLTLASSVASGQVVTVAYTDPTAGNDANAIQDVAGNDVASIAASSVTNNTPASDTIAPVFVSARVNGATLVLKYADTNLLDATGAPATTDFSVLVNSGLAAVDAVTVDAYAKTVTLTLAVAVVNGQSVTVAYSDPTPGDDANAIQDTAGNDAASLAATTVTNDTPLALAMAQEPMAELIGVSGAGFAVY